jgi:hypothetical protein
MKIYIKKVITDNTEFNDLDAEIKKHSKAFFASNGNLERLETDNPKLIAWAKTKGLKQDG